MLVYEAVFIPQHSSSTITDNATNNFLHIQHLNGIYYLLMHDVIKRGAIFI